MWRQEKTSTGSDLIYDGVEFGIASSPTKGTANIQNANISTQSGEVLASYGRTAQQQVAITNGTLTPDGATNFTGPSSLKAGMWINVTASTVTSISTTTTPTTASADYLLVGGGGAGGSSDSGGGAGGGGGAGQVLSSSSAFAVGSYLVTVGAGGTAVSQGTGNTGASSVIAGVATAYGGAGGGKNSVNGANAATGGSGGGGGGGATTGGTGATGGNNGGNGNLTTEEAGGGGGGAGAVGGNASVADGGTGGIGVSNSITGTATFYGGGGGGGRDTGDGGIGGQGGGANANLIADSSGSAGTANTGGGGGGSAGNFPFVGGAGGTGIVVISYPLGSMVATGGSISLVNGNVVHTFLNSGSFNVLSIAKINLYYVSYASGTTFKLSSKFDPTGANALTHGVSGSITFSTVATPNRGVAKAVEKYTTATTVDYRYYVLDANSYVWVFDTLINRTYGTQWMLPDPNDYSILRLTGIGALNGQLMTVGKAFIVSKPTTDLGRTFVNIDGGFLNEPFPTHNNFAMVGNQGKMYYCDGNYIGEVFATTSLITSIANIQSQCKYTASTITGTVSEVVSGSLPYSPEGTRIPVLFHTDVYGTQPTNVNTFTVYYIEHNVSSGNFQVFSSKTSTVAIDIAAGAAGNQFFTTFWPFGNTGANGTTPTVQISTQRVNLPSNETAQTMVEIGNTVLIGGKTNLIYPWNQIDATPSDFIALPENDVKKMVNVNNVAYIFAGNKGNIYVSNGSVASLSLKVPDYCAGVPGTPLTYIEPIFTWGDAAFIRGRVYFSILDQTATKAGNCGGIWSFVPSQNIDPSQEIGMALRLENQQSYGDYDGYANLIIANQEQSVTSPQYWAVWQDGITNPSYGIDYTSTTPVTQYVIETDLFPSGTLLDKTTFSQIEYKLATPLTTGDGVQMFYRLNATDSWSSCGIVKEESDKISGYFTANFQKTQWTQLRAVVTTGGTTASSFVRLTQIRLR